MGAVVHKETRRRIVCMHTVHSSVVTECTCLHGAPYSQIQSCAKSQHRSPCAAESVAPWDTGEVKSWAGLWCGSGEASYCSSHSCSHCLCPPPHCPGHPKLDG